MNTDPPTAGARRVGTGSLAPYAALLAALTALAAGPLVAPLLPAGPGGLLAPDSVAVAAGGLAVLLALLLWPSFAASRGVFHVAGTGAVLLALSLPFVVALARAAGSGPATIGAACAVVAACVFVTAVFLAGPGRHRRADRWFVAGAVLFLFAAPLMNYAVSEFGRSGIEIGYRLSPLLVLRGLLLERPGADPVPFLLLAAAVSALLLAGRFLSGAAVVVLLAAAASRAEEVEVHPLLGDLYAPGRVVPLLVTAPARGRSVGASAARGAVVRGPERAEGAFLPIPGPERLDRVGVRLDAGEATVEVPVAVRPRPPGRRWFVVVGPVSPALRAAAEEKGIALSRARPEAESLGPGLLPVDGVVDLAGRLPEARVAGIRARGIPVVRRVEDLPDAAAAETLVRRIWEEPGRVLEAGDLYRCFPPAPRFDPARSRTALLVLAGFAALAVMGIRFAVRRGWSPVRSLLVLLPPALAAVVVAVLALPPPEPVRWDSIVLREGARVVSLHRVRGLRDAVVERSFRDPPVPLGRAEDVEIRYGDEAWIRVPVRAHQERIFVVEGAAEARPPGPDAPFDLLVFPRGLARPGEAPRPVVDFLRDELDGPRARALPKLLRLGAERRGTWGVRFPGPGVGEIEVVRVE